jgi:hypothetical protein
MAIDGRDGRGSEGDAIPAGVRRAFVPVDDDDIRVVSQCMREHESPEARTAHDDAHVIPTEGEGDGRRS